MRSPIYHAILFLLLALLHSVYAHPSTVTHPSSAPAIPSANAVSESAVAAPVAEPEAPWPLSLLVSLARSSAAWAAEDLDDVPASIARRRPRRRIRSHP